MFLSDVAAFCEVHRSQFYRWLERGEQEALRLLQAESNEEEPLESEAIYLSFRDAIEHSRAHANIADMNVIWMAARDDPH